MTTLLLTTAFAQEPVERPEKVTVSVARLPLPAGKKLDWDDLTTVDLPSALVPETAVVKGVDLVGRVLAHPVAQQSPFVGPRLQGWVAPEVASTTTELSWELGPLAALIQAGDTLLFVRPGRDACRLVEAEVVKRGSPAVLSVPVGTVVPEDAVALLGGAGASAGTLERCAVTP